MAFEELPADYAKFFETGELPAALAAEHAIEAPAVVPETITPEPAAHTPPVEPQPEIPVVPQTPAPSASPDAALYERLLADRDIAEQALKRQIAELTEKVEKVTAVPVPDKTTDPLGYMMHKIEALEQAATGSVKATEEMQATAAQQQANTQLQNHLNAQIQTFEKDHTDYQDSYKHLVKMRMQDFTDLGLTTQQAQQAMDNEARGIISRALATGKNPAELVYGMAKRYGFAGKAPVVTAENKLATIQKGMETSTEAVERSTPPEAKGLSIAAVKNMSDRDLTRVVDKQWEELFGSSKGIF